MLTFVTTARDRAKFFTSCTPGRFNNEGRLDKRPLQNASYAGGAQRFFALLNEWRADGELAGLVLELRPATAPGPSR